MNTSKFITISLFRVRPGDSTKLDMIFSCFTGYYFTSLILDICYLVNGEFVNQQYDLSPAIFKVPTQGEQYQTRYAISLPLDKLEIYQSTIYPAIYTGTFTIARYDQNVEAITEENNQDVAVCSDVNYAYHCMLKDLLEMQDLSSCNQCVEVSDELIRKYLILYGHYQALNCGDGEFAKTFFKIINNCFGNCPSTPINCGCASKRVTSCNCGK